LPSQSALILLVCLKTKHACKSIKYAQLTNYFKLLENNLNFD